jgi:cell division protein FtsL
MTRLHLVLLVVLVASALVLVHTSYERRRLFAAHQRAEVEGMRIEQEFKRLDAMRQLQATHQRVAREAERQLQMRKAVQRLEVYERDAAGGRP